MLKIKHIDHIVLRVVGVQKMLDFYLGVLGCSLEKVQPDIGLVQIRAGASLIDFVALDGPLGKAGGAAPGKEGRNLDHFCLSLEGPFDGAAISASLESHGARPGEWVSRYGADGQALSIYVSDPEGNVVELKGPPGSAL